MKLAWIIQVAPKSNICLYKTQKGKIHREAKVHVAMEAETEAIQS